MSRILIIVFSAAMLTGCASDSTYDKTAMPDASMMVRQASLNCLAKWDAEEFKTYAELAACNLTAERKFFTAIKLEKMDRFELYAARYQTLAADRDAHRISDQQAGRRANTMLRDFLAECRCKKERMPGGEMFIASSPGYLGP